MKAEYVPGTVAKRLYYDSPELLFEAEVTDIRLMAQQRSEDGEPAQLWQVALDQTAFYPESGGQPWDTGVLVATARSGATLDVPVERVEEDASGEVWHQVRKPLVQGTRVTGRVDPGRRVDHMQQHSGQHLLSAVFLEQLGARTVSFHLGEELSTIDLVLPALHTEQLVSVEEATNVLIAENRPLRFTWHSREEAQDLLAAGKLRKLPERDGPMRVVEIEGVELNACGGTHVASTAAIGSVLLRQPEKVKQGWRVPFVCGLRAVRTAREDTDLLQGVAHLLSVGRRDVPARVTRLQAENKQVAKERQSLLLELAEGVAAGLLATAPPGEVPQAIFRDKPVEFGKRVVSVLAAAGRAGVVGLQQEGGGALVLALPVGDARHAGKLLQEVASVHGAQGGGSAQIAQGVCQAEQVKTLVDAVVQRLR